MTKRTLALTILSALGLVIKAQEKKIPLVEALAELQLRYNITFTYADANLRGIEIILPPAQLPVEEVLDYLAKSTGLVFEALEEGFVAIRRPRDPISSACGHLIDAESGEPIIGATIQAGDKYGISDESGRFEITGIDGDVPLVIRSLGYNTRTVRLEGTGDEPCPTWLLQVQPITLQEIIVSNFLAKGINKTSLGSFAIQTGQLGILPGLVEPDVLQAIQALPGIQSTNEKLSDINVRGGTNDQNLILWDGIKMYQAGHFFGLISAYNPYLTDQVTLIKNGTTAALGDGVSSTIDIRSEDGLAQEFSGGGGVNMINTDVFAKIPLSKKATVQLSSRRSFSGILQTPTYDQYFDRAFRDTDVFRDVVSVNEGRVSTDQTFTFSDVSARLLYHVTPKDRFKVDFLNISNNIEYQENAVIDSVLESRNSGLEQKSLASSVSYSRLWNSRLRTSAMLYLSRYQLLAVNFDIFNDQRLIQENEVLDTGLKLDGRWSISEEFGLFTGYQFFEIGVSNLEDINVPRFRRFTKRVIRSHAFFSEGEYTSSSGRTQLTLGLRANYFEKFNKLLVEPRLALSHQFQEHFSWEILGEFKSQATTQRIDFQNDFLGIEQRRWVLSDEENTPIVQSRQVSTGLHFQKNDLLISVEGYYKKVEGITSSSQGFQDQFQFVDSIGNYDAIGLDLLINPRFDKFSTWVGYSLADNTFEFPGFQPASFPNNLDIRHIVTLGTSYESGGFQLSAGLNWHTGRPFTAPVGLVEDEIIYGDPNQARLDNYLRVDLSAKYNFNLSETIRAQAGAAVWNVLDRENIVDVYYRSANGQPQAVEQNALGITPNLVFRVFF